MSSRKIVRLVLSFVLLLPPLAVFMLIALTALTHRQRPLRTGDALSDAYLQALVGSGAWDIMQDGNYSGTQGVIPEAQWRLWEQQFGQDPQFWLLCYHQRPWGEEYVSRFAGVKTTGNTRFLEAARERGVADWRVLRWLAGGYTGKWNQEARDVLGLNQPKNKAPPREWLDFYAKTSVELLRRHGPQLRQISDELRRAGKDQAVAYYQLAMLEAECCDVKGALADIRAGNAAAHNDMDLGPPYSLLVREARQGRPLTGDAVVSGMLASDYLSVALPNFLRYKNMVRVLSAWAVQNGDLAALDALHEYCCRFGMAEGAASIQALVAVVNDGIVLDAIATIQPPSAQRKAVISQARVALGQIKSTVRMTGSMQQGLTPVLKAQDVIMYLFAAPNCGGRYVTLDYQQKQGQYLLSEQTAMAGPVRQQFEALAKISLR
jgi:hypothetical protein